jgi:DNA-binding MarR family transcriptional regulator
METLTDQQHHLLAALRAAGKATAAELVSLITPQGMVGKILRESEQQGFVKRYVDEGEGRELWQLTARGTDVLDAEG